MNEAIGQPPARSARWAWALCWIMFAGTVLNYMDRQAIALVKPSVVSEFQITSDATYGWVLAAFMLPYAIFQVPAGFLVDSGNVRRIYALAVGGWSLAGIAAAFSPTLGILIACRVALGVGESFNWPCGLRVTSRILAPADRGLGNGIFNSGAAVGAVIAPLTIPLLAQRFGWRSSFALVGGLGFVWVAVWLSVRPAGVDLSAPVAQPNTAGRLSKLAKLAFGGLAAISASIGATAWWFGPNAVWLGFAVLMLGALLVALLLPSDELSGRNWSESLGAIVRKRRFWVLVVVSISINVAWHYLVNWMASFFQTERKLGMVGGAAISAVPFLAADAGNILGGAASRMLARRGMRVATARTSVMAVGAALMAGGTIVGRIDSTAWIVVIVSLMAVGAASIMANYFALCQDVSPSHTGLVVGVLGGLGNLFAAGFLPLAGRLKDVTGTSSAAFMIVGLLPIVGVVTLASAWGTEEAGEGKATFVDPDLA